MVKLDYSDISKSAINEYRKSMGPFPADSYINFRLWWNELVDCIPEQSWITLTKDLPVSWDDVVICRIHEIGKLNCCSFINDDGKISSIPFLKSWEIL